MITRNEDLVKEGLVGCQTQGKERRAPVYLHRAVLIAYIADLQLGMCTLDNKREVAVGICGSTIPRTLLKNGNTDKRLVLLVSHRANDLLLEKSFFREC